METVKGKVAYVNYNEKFGLYSFTIGGRDGFFSCGKVNPQVTKGDFITFEFENNGKYNNVSVPTIQKSEGTQQVEGGAEAAASSTKAKPARSSGYVANDDRQKMISYQAAANTSLSFLELALANDALKLPAKQNVKLDALKAIWVEETENLFRTYQQIPERYDELCAEETKATIVDAAGESEEDFLSE